MKAFTTIMRIDEDRKNGGYFVESDEGMDLRDHFAGLAMQGLVSDSSFTGDGENYQRSVAELSYRIADAMMEARK